MRSGAPALPASESRQWRDSEWTARAVTARARGLRAFPIGLGQEGRGEPMVRVTKLRGGGLPSLRPPTATVTVTATLRSTAGGHRHVACLAALARLGVDGNGARSACVCNRPRSGGEGRTDGARNQAAWRPPKAAYDQPRWQWPPSCLPSLFRAGAPPSRRVRFSSAFRCPLKPTQPASAAGVARWFHHSPAAPHIATP